MASRCGLVGQKWSSSFEPLGTALQHFTSSLPRGPAEVSHEPQLPLGVPHTSCGASSAEGEECTRSGADCTSVISYNHRTTEHGGMEGTPKDH